MSQPQDSLRKIPFSKIIRIDEDNKSRSKRDPDKVQEKVNSIRKHGILHNIGVGPANENGEHFVIFGFGRHYATELLLEELAKEGTEESFRLMGADPEHPEDDRTMIPCRILTLAEAVSAQEIQLIENLQQEAVDPVDEARGYAQLLEKKREDGTKAYSHESLAAALGIPKKGEDYIRLRLKLLDAPEELLDAVRQPEGPALRVAELIGKMMPGKNKTEAAARAIKDKYTGRPMTVKSVIEMIGTDYQKSLRGCDFDTEATDLLTPAEMKEFNFTGKAGEESDGSCKNCPLRSGNDKTLEGLLVSPGGGGVSEKDRGLDTMVCQHLACFEKKQRNAWRLLEQNAENNGFRVMHKERAKALFPYGAKLSNEASGSTEFVQQDARLDYNATGHMAEETMPTWGDLLADTKVSWILVKTPSGKRVYILERETAYNTVDATPACWAITGGKNPLANRPKAKKSVSAALVSKVLEGDLSKPLPKAVKGTGGSGGGQKKNWEEEKAEREKREAENHKVLCLAQEQIGERLKTGAKPSAETMLALIEELFNCMGSEEMLGCYLGLWVKADALPYKEKLEEVSAKLKQVVQTYEDGMVILLLLIATDPNEPEGGLGKPMTLLAADLGVDLAECRLKAVGEIQDTRLEDKRSIPNAALAGVELYEREMLAADALLEEAKPDFDLLLEPIEHPEPGVYHCDECHSLAIVDAEEVREVEEMFDGEFICSHCHPDGFQALSEQEAADYEPWTVNQTKTAKRKA
jgi:ParB-like chromosome segregation protein Spo0J